MKVNTPADPLLGLTDDLSYVSLEQLAAACRAETTRFLKDESSTDAFALEIFRRAICQRDQEAWAVLFGLYRGLLTVQLRRHSMWSEGLEDSEDWVHRAFERFWIAVGPNRFNMFSDLGSILKYLKMCLHSVILDEARSRRTRQWARLEDAALLEDASGEDLEDTVLGGLAGSDLWKAVVRELRGEAEYIVASLSFVRGLRPREIIDLYPQAFGGIADVYRIKRNIVERLRHRQSSAVGTGFASG